jgi:hypothetical protein
MSATPHDTRKDIHIPMENDPEVQISPSQADPTREQTPKWGGCQTLKGVCSEDQRLPSVSSHRCFDHRSGFLRSNLRLAGRQTSRQCSPVRSASVRRSNNLSAQAYPRIPRTLFSRTPKSGEQGRRQLDLHNTFARKHETRFHPGGLSL